MGEHSQSAVADQLIARWKRWVAIVRLLVSRREERLGVNPAKYESLHSELLQLCRTAETKEASPGQATFQKIENTLAPWVTLDSLVRANPEIVARLLDRCLKIQAELEPRRASRWIPARLTGVMLRAGVVLATGAALLAMLCRGSSPPGSPLATVKNCLRQALEVVTRSDCEQSVLIQGAVVTLALICLVWRSTGRR